MRDFVLNETNYGTTGSNDYDQAILPWGATEPHNYQLPYGTDTLERCFIAETATSKARLMGSRVMILPWIPLGMQNPGQVDIPFCLNVSINTQKSILVDIDDSLSQQGINKLLVLKGHGGNDFKAVNRELSVSLKDFFLGLSNWYEILENNKYFDSPGDHAGEMETSIMMYAYPDLVDDNPKQVKENISNSLYAA